MTARTEASRLVAIRSKPHARLVLRVVAHLLTSKSASLRFGLFRYCASERRTSFPISGVVDSPALGGGHLRQ
jgi:hypothetical protein